LKSRFLFSLGKIKDTCYILLYINPTFAFAASHATCYMRTTKENSIANRSFPNEVGQFAQTFLKRIQGVFKRFDFLWNEKQPPKT